jgi:hypothetical protein
MAEVIAHASGYTDPDAAAIAATMSRAVADLANEIATGLGAATALAP